MLESDTFMKAFHHVLLEAWSARRRRAPGGCFLRGASGARAAQVHVEEGALICPESGHRFVIRHVTRLDQPVPLWRSLTRLQSRRSEGIPNMLLAEDEVPTK